MKGKIDRHLVVLLTLVMVCVVILVLNVITLNQQQDNTKKPYDRLIDMADSYLYNDSMTIGMLEVSDSMTIAQVKQLYIKGKNYPYFRGMMEPMVDRICQG